MAKLAVARAPKSWAARVEIDRWRFRMRASISAARTRLVPDDAAALRR
jgi:hypothetical protein